MTARADQTGWVLTHLDDVCSDLSVFHGVRDASRLDAVTFHKLTYRLAAYQGAVAARAAAQQAEATVTVTATVGACGSPRRDADVRARFRAAQAMPVASAAELMAAVAPVSGLPAVGTITSVPG